MAKTEKEKKQELINKWEEIFGKKMDDVLTEAGMKFINDESTSYDELADFLDHCAVNEAMGNMKGMIGFLFCGGNDDDEEEGRGHCPNYEPCNIKNGTPYKVAEVYEDKINHVLDGEFETEEAAKAWIQDKVNHSTHTLDDFCVIQMQVCK